MNPILHPIGMSRNLPLALLAAILAAPSLAQSQTELKRTPILTAPIAPNKTVDHVQVTRLDFPPGQATGRHMHPIPVVGYVQSGTFIVQIEGQPEHSYTAGEVIYEPANTTIARYDNASSTEPAVLIAYYLAGPDDKVLIQLLPPR
jgi:quercetin dioxygenase-like cupin family protein